MRQLRSGRRNHYRGTGNSGSSARLFSGEELRSQLARGASPDGDSSPLAATGRTPVSLAFGERVRSNIMRKLSFHSIRDLVVYAIKNNLIQIEIPPPKTPTGPTGPTAL